MLVIWGRLSSVNVQKVVFAADALGLVYQRNEAGGVHGVVDTPGYRAMNPNGLVPTLQDDDTVLWESNAIVRYLAAKHGAGTLWPVDPVARARADRWMDWQQTTLNPAVGPAFVNLVRTAPEKRDMAAVEASRVKTNSVTKVLDAHLGEHAFLAGDSFTMAECVVGPQLHRWLNMPIERENRPNLEAWYNRLTENPASRTAFPRPIT
ncbi:glutathione S-transferase [Alsobacter metallidurans]|uniref:Glutathione S-transferase n=1 Tax=Alsobacter metallidurans TaxID=340221 RepID=A0A917MKQ8_9HYPH|nr:glutathione S-transferase [Alsobacter metallidurans]GGH25205.1 glutathione S-transferase [Alsobacter metallidurans]